MLLNILGVKHESDASPGKKSNSTNNDLQLFTEICNLPASIELPAREMPNLPGDINLDKPAQILEMDSRDIEELLLRYSKQNKKTWGKLDINLTNFFEPGQNHHSDGTGQGPAVNDRHDLLKDFELPGNKPGSKNPGIEVIAIKQEPRSINGCSHLNKLAAGVLEQENFESVQQPAQRSTGSPFGPDKLLTATEKPVQNPVPATGPTTGPTTAPAKEINTGEKDALLTRQIQLQPGRDAAPSIQQQGNTNGSIPQAAQLAARLAPVIQQAVFSAQGTTTLHLKLKPEHLGEVTVRLVYNQGNLQAHFVAASVHTRELLEQSMVYLKENLLQLNINLNDSSTSSGDDSGRWAQQGSWQQKHHQMQKNDFSLLSPEDILPEQPLSEASTAGLESKGLNYLV